MQLKLSEKVKNRSKWGAALVAVLTFLSQVPWTDLIQWASSLTK